MMYIRLVSTNFNFISFLLLTLARPDLVWFSATRETRESFSLTDSNKAVIKHLKLFVQLLNTPFDTVIR